MEGMGQSASARDLAAMLETSEPRGNTSTEIDRLKLQEGLLAQSAKVLWSQSVISYKAIGLVASIIRNNLSRLNLVGHRKFMDDAIEQRVLPTGVVNARSTYRSPSRTLDRVRVSLPASEAALTTMFILGGCKPHQVHLT
jgi:hypothetical protein